MDLVTVFCRETLFADTCFTFLRDKRRVSLWRESKPYRPQDDYVSPVDLSESVCFLTKALLFSYSVYLFCRVDQLSAPLPPGTLTMATPDNTVSYQPTPTSPSKGNNNALASQSMVESPSIPTKSGRKSSKTASVHSSHGGSVKSQQALAPGDAKQQKFEQQFTGRRLRLWIALVGG